MSELFEPDGPHDRRLALGQPAGLLHDFNRAGVVTSADVQVARRLGALAAAGAHPTPDEERAQLALALCVRALRSGSVCLDLDTVDYLAPELPEGLRWPTYDEWCAALDGSGLVQQQVLHREGPLVHLDRYRQEELQIAADLRARDAVAAPEVDLGLLDEGLDRVFPAETDEEQRTAVRHAMTRRTTVLTGGPGTGKTTTVAGLLALLVHQADAVPDGPALRIALAAPTGKAAARLAEAVNEAVDGPVESAGGTGGAGAGRSRLDGADRDALRRAVATAQSSTLHRLLGSVPGSSTRFRHHRGNRLPHDVVVVDEASMLSLTMTARLLEAVRPQARLVLVGDPDQLASVEAGAVLADLVAGFPEQDGSGPVVRLRTAHRYGAQIGTFAEALRGGADDDADDADAVVRLARGEDGSGDAVRFVETPAADASPEQTIEGVLRDDLVRRALAVRAAALVGDPAGALELLARHRVLCAHRLGPYGVQSMNDRVERWLAEADPGVVPGGMYAGKPLLVVRNDPQLKVWNGDVGVVFRTADGGLRVRFATGAGVQPKDVAVSRVADVETMHAMTIHKAQGSQADEVTVLLPDTASRLLTRELLYTAVTRARLRVRLVGSEESLRAAFGRRVQRASGLRARLAPAADATG
ncbi:exodeoxyribonuclease V subunit alpha [Nocardioides alkalitolerans]|uniref:exodeoxyribonuclease V subunit alpha n=1 Tax=Nocardioides alkalitolerans TaxID=281714 RepID=UPI00040C95F7|nr:exodeoxyribonuclease V subunit alpha [Nocardioides alkalitolerans]